MASRTDSWRLDRVALNVGDLSAASAFYRDALGFSDIGVAASDAALAECLGVRAVRAVRLRRGRQVLELCECKPAGAPVPPDGRSNDASFQHCALVTPDMGTAYARLRRFAFSPISRSGPQKLPGGIVAFKFRDPEGHPLELIAFPHPHPATAGGIDHSAICITDLDASIAFYAAHLGLTEQSRQVNEGLAQDALDDLDGAKVDVVALAPAIRAPHVELLAYRHPSPRKMPAAHPSDRAASRLVFANIRSNDPNEARLAGGDLTLLHDPDGHAILVDRTG
jgi:catechol 2,3-dioxygenase-like lactoylglutathione lyase family enzyme